MRVTNETLEYRKLLRKGILPRIFPPRDKSKDRIIVVQKNSTNTASVVYREKM